MGWLAALLLYPVATFRAAPPLFFAAFEEVTCPVTVGDVPAHKAFGRHSFAVFVAASFGVLSVVSAIAIVVPATVTAAAGEVLGLARVDILVVVIAVARFVGVACWGCATLLGFVAVAVLVAIFIAVERAFYTFIDLAVTVVVFAIALFGL